MRRIPVTLSLATLALVAMATSVQAQCGITGSSLIGTTPANLCGTGGTEYMWEGPNGYNATSRCVSLTQAGEYSLYAYDGNIGQWFGPCLINVTGELIEPPPPPPPPPVANDTLINCPRPAWFWTRGCRTNARGNDRVKQTMSAEQLAAVALAVDQRSQLFGWADARAGFCATMRMPGSNDLRGRAVRQFAAVLANLAASEMKLVPVDGREVHLRDNTLLGSDVARGMELSAWVAATDAELASLAAAAATDRNARKAYQRIRRVGWMINHGMGIGDVCPRGATTSAGERDDDESMAMALASDEGMSGIVMESAMPNPFRDQTRIVYTMQQAGDVELSVLDLSGRLVKTLVRGAQSAGRHEMSWDGRTDAGQSLPAGAYFVHGRVGEQRVQGRIVMIR